MASTQHASAEEAANVPPSIDVVIRKVQQLAPPLDRGIATEGDLTSLLGPYEKVLLENPNLIAAAGSRSYQGSHASTEIITGADDGHIADNTTSSQTAVQSGVNDNPIDTHMAEAPSPYGGPGSMMFFPDDEHARKARSSYRNAAETGTDDQNESGSATPSASDVSDGDASDLEEDSEDEDANNLATDSDTQDSEVADASGSEDEDEDEGPESTPMIGDVKVDGRPYSYHSYFGEGWDEMIHKLHSVEPMQDPSKSGKMNTLTPHDYQLLGAAQMHYLCMSRFRGGLLGDEMGLGKTMQGILMLYLVKDEPGLSLVVAPASICAHWVECIHNYFKPEFAMKALHLTKSKVSAHELYASDYDVIVVSFEFVHASRQRLDRYEKEVESYRKQTSGLIPMPERPKCALLSNFWQDINCPFKRLIIDEAHLVSLREGGLKHESLMKLHVQATVCMSGTLPHNKWFAVSGYLDYIRGHPFTTHKLFMKSFRLKSRDQNAGDDDFDIHKLEVLQKLLQAFTIARPLSTSSKLNLKPGVEHRVDFSIPNDLSCLVRMYTAKYKQIAARERVDLMTNQDKSTAAFYYATKAVFASMHPLLLSRVYVDKAMRKRRAGKRPKMALGDKRYLPEEMAQSTERGQWLKRIELHGDLISESCRLNAIMETYKYCREHYPADKIIIFSQYLKFLDIIYYHFKKSLEIDAVRFDGTVPVTQRKETQEMFKNAASHIPLLITAGAGGVGLNLQYASIVIQCEVWWNANVEKQAKSRVFRPGLEAEFKYFRIECVNSEIEQEIKAVQKKKTKINNMVMKALVRKHTEGAAPLAIIRGSRVSGVSFKNLPIDMGKGKTADVEVTDTAGSEGDEETTGTDPTAESRQLAPPPLLPSQPGRMQQTTAQPSGQGNNAAADGEIPRATNANNKRKLDMFRLDEVSAGDEDDE